MVSDVEPYPTVPPPASPPPGVTGPAPVRRRQLRVELAVMAFAAAVPAVVIALRGFTDPADVDLELPVIELVATLLAALGPAAIAVYLLWRDGRLEAAGFGRRPAGFVLGYGALGWVCCFIALVALGLVVQMIVLLSGGDADEVARTDDLDLTVGVVLAALAISLVAGVGEEIVYRAYAISRMEEAGFGRAAVIAPWAIFTVAHLYQGPIALVVIGIVGAVFVWLYRWKRSIWPVMVAHALYDIFVILLAVAST
jgi:membrane protease YdiL (CAAX protease family)